MIEHSPSAERNRHDILPVLAEILADTGQVLEVPCGTGQHAVHFAEALKGLRWQPADVDPVALRSTQLRSEESALPNLAPPIRLDVCDSQWPLSELDGIICINLLHIAPWGACVGLMRGAQQCLRSGGLLYLYGAYLQKGKKTAPSNLDFDASLRERNSEWGVRLLEEVVAVAEEHQLHLREVREMPNNNLSVIFVRE